MEETTSLLLSFQARSLEGEFSTQGQDILWVYETSLWDDDTQDRLYETSCNVREDLRPLPGGWSFEDLWSDNDSIGFTVKKILL